MVEFVSSDARIKATLEKLGDVLVRNGAYLHPDLRVVCESGNFSMHANVPVKNGERAVYVPPSCFVHSCKFSFSSDGRNIVIESVEDDVPPLQQEIAALVIELYNLAGKFEQYKKNSVYCLYHEAPDLFQALTTSYQFRITKHFEAMPFDVAFLNAFLELRTLGKERVIVPMIEYFNHTQRAKITRIVEPDAGMEAIVYMLPGQDEFFINYGLERDARAFFLYEGFLDQSIEVINSLVLEFSVGDINIGVYRRPQIPTLDDLPANMKDLYGYCPYFLKGERKMGFGFLYIPGRAAPRALRRVLHYGISKIVDDSDRATQIMLQVERKVILENLSYYEDLKKKLDVFTPSPQSEAFIAHAKEMAQSQLLIIKNYAFFDEAMKAGG